ncbi:MAG: Cys-tRNA(Pro)/Cys-tRNA(Cys) deacylase [Acidimicrobiia bacterium]|jgi:Cys-tRNA(Pro)/Cys-tRNA(Cys) deacylase|nr:Cys-tRNA(Pro)/Cys-tRNA(Cys) deacylase [Acidimicrobiia bacterium]
MAATRATQLLDRAGVRYRLHSYEHDPNAEAYGAAAAAALGVEPNRVFKTLVSAVEGGTRPVVVAIVPISARLDLKALAAAVGGKRAAMSEAATAERLTGYVVGGISPLGQKRRLPTVVDASAEVWPTVFCSAGRRGLEIELAAADLLRLTGASYAIIAQRT